MSLFNFSLLELRLELEVQWAHMGVMARFREIKKAEQANEFTLEVKIV